MKRFTVFIFIFFIVFGMPAGASAEISALSAVVTDGESGEVLYDKNSEMQLPMASTTKIMTAVCVLENINVATPVIIDNRSVGIEGSSVYLREGEFITVAELLYAMLLNSGNDAATALALSVSDSVEEFAELMTETAQRIGAKNTRFQNPSGLYDENHYTTAHDLALITAYAMKNEIFAQIVSTKKIKISSPEKGKARYLSNHNRLLSSFDGCTGVKTGYTKKCGRCLVSSAERDGKNLICVTLNAPDDWNDHRKLLNMCFDK